MVGTVKDIVTAGLHFLTFYSKVRFSHLLSFLVKSKGIFSVRTFNWHIHQIDYAMCGCHSTSRRKLGFGV